MNIKTLKRKGWNLHDTRINRAKRTITPHGIDYILNNLPGETGRIIDVGCSSGETTKELALLCPNHEVVGLDFEQKKIDEAKEKNSLPNTVYLCGDGTKLNDYFNQGSIDAVFALNSITFLHLLTEDLGVVKKFVKGSEKVLKENGTLVATLNMAMLMAYKGEEMVKKFYQETYGLNPATAPGFLNGYVREDSLKEGLNLAYVREMLLAQPKEIKTPLTKSVEDNYIPTDYFRDWVSFFNQEFMIKENGIVPAKELEPGIIRDNFNHYGQYSKRYPFRIKKVKDRKDTKVYTSLVEKK